MTTTNQIKAILFDADGVVIVPPHQFYHYTLDTLHIPREETDRYFATSLFLDCLTGKADLKETIAPFLPKWGWQDSVDAFLQTWFEVEHQLDQRVVGHINQLKARGIFCGLGTNQEKYRLAYMKEKMGFGTLFDASFASCEVGALKNDPSYFVTVTQRLGFTPQQILFFDDSARNVETALAFGWQAEVYITFEAFQQTLMKLNLI